MSLLNATFEANLQWLLIFRREGYFDEQDQLRKEFVTIDAAKVHYLSNTNQLFDFPALLPELQLAVVEWLDYHDLKALE